ncbi:uncharacterized protein ARMOST_12307 [Armillaria ostoyae]|uniref:Uncharacterized protein n=1 Tax=Armillaria ostoyae TaxID=47428 RepID=A0A284RJM6_ARMOS|nr:uncharacterized protein ARMOST_12307 [Armillaria ostoyae]
MAYDAASHRYLDSLGFFGRKGQSARKLWDQNSFFVFLHHRPTRNVSHLFVLDGLKILNPSSSFIKVSRCQVSDFAHSAVNINRTGGAEFGILKVERVVSMTMMAVEMEGRAWFNWQSVLLLVHNGHLKNLLAADLLRHVVVVGVDLYRHRHKREIALRRQLSSLHRSSLPSLPSSASPKYTFRHDLTINTITIK